MVGLPTEVEDSLEKNALANAVRHGGRSDVGAVVSKVLGEFPEMRTRAQEVARGAKETVARVNSMKEHEQVSLLRAKYPDYDAQKEQEGRVGLPPLPGAERGKASFRLPPEPSGYMHIGHAMSFTINYEYRVKYDGHLWLRFEDTNPRKVTKAYYESFKHGISWLGIKWDEEKNVSEDTEEIYEYGGRLISDGRAYACSCPAEKVKRLRFEGVECEHRQRSVEENSAIWDGMLARKYGEGEMVIRLRGDMKSLDHSLRDPNLFRVIDHPHPVTGTRYVVWPTYDLANAVEDELCGITHVLRSSEFHTDLQQLLRDALGFRRPTVIQFSRYNFKGTPVAKRLLRPLVEKGLVEGWDDPRMPTVEGVRRRGIIPETLRQFTLQVGYTKSEHEFDWSLLFAVNRKLLDPVSRRVYFVPDPVAVSVVGAPARSVRIAFHPTAELGERNIETGDEFYLPKSDLGAMKEGDVFRMMELYNVRLLRGGTKPELEFAGDDLNRETRKVQWVTNRNRRVKVLTPGVLFNDAGEFNSESLLVTEGLAEEASSTIEEGEIVQFPRFGFCRLDSPGTLILAHK